jgi:hypothetical protein
MEMRMTAGLGFCGESGVAANAAADKSNPAKVAMRNPNR